MKKILILVALSLFSSSVFAQLSPVQMQIQQLRHESTLRYIANVTQYSTECLNDLSKSKKPNFKKYHDSCSYYMSTIQNSTVS